MMDSSVDNKLNMSLDDIIKRERKLKMAGKQGAAVVARKRAAGIKRNIKGRKSGSLTNVNANANTRIGGLPASAAMRVVNRLVKRAIQRRANQSLINRAATLRRRAVRRSAVVRPATRLLRVRRQPSAVASRLEGRLSGISQRSRTIARSVQLYRRPAVFASSQIVRGRGASRLGRLVSDNEEIVTQQREINPPVRQQQMLRRAMTSAKSRRRRQLFIQRRLQPVIVEQQPVIVRRGGIRKRVVFDEEPNVVVINAPRRKAQFRNQPVFERAQRVVTVKPRKRVVQADFGTSFIENPNAAQMRKALGIGVRQMEPQRFESSSSFLQRIPVANRRGRGFQNIVYE